MTTHYLNIITPFWRLVYLIPSCEALKESADVGMSIYITHSKSVPLVIIGGIAAFIAQTTLTGETVKDNLEETLYVISLRKLPANWPKISKRKEIAALIFTLIAAGFAAPSAAWQTYYFFDFVPEEYSFARRIHPIIWAALSSTIATGSGLNALLTETVESYHAFRWLLSDEQATYSNNFSKYASPLIGGTLGVLNAIQRAVQGFVAIKTIFDVEKNSGKYPLGIASTFDIFSNFSFIGVLNIKTLDRFFGYLAEKKLEPRKVAALFFALGLSLFVANLKRPLNVDFYHEVAMYYEFDDVRVTDPLFEILSAIIVTQESINLTGALYYPIFRLIDNSCNKTMNAYEKINVKLQQAQNYMKECLHSKPIAEEKQQLINTETGDTTITDYETKFGTKKSTFNHYRKKNSCLLFDCKTPREQQTCKPLYPQCGII